MLRRGLLVVLLLGLVVPASAEARSPCRDQHRCVKVLHASDHLRRWRTPEQVPADARLWVHVWAGKHRLREVVDGTTVIYLGHGALMKLTASERRAPLKAAFVATRPMRLRLVYWWR